MALNSTQRLERVQSIRKLAEPVELFCESKSVVIDSAIIPAANDQLRDRMRLSVSLNGCAFTITDPDPTKQMLALAYADMAEMWAKKLVTLAQSIREQFGDNAPAGAKR